MATLKEGMRVQVRARPVQGKEAQEGRYAPHLANATGTILKIYTPQEVAVELDLESLPEPLRQRHLEQQARMHERWLNSLSEEARTRLTEEEKAFRLRYVVLLAAEDLIPLEQKRTKSTATATKPAAEPAKTRTAQSRSLEPAPEEPPRRPTTQELEAMEAQYLEARRQQRKR